VDSVSLHKKKKKAAGELTNRIKSSQVESSGAQYDVVKADLFVLYRIPVYICHVEGSPLQHLINSDSIQLNYTRLGSYARNQA
jgi:hypothetical protein